MVRKYSSFATILFSTVLLSQVGINTTQPDPSSILDIHSTDKGVLLPRVKLDEVHQKLSTFENAESLLVYNTGSDNVPKGFYSWDGGEWKVIAGSANLQPGNVGEVLTTVDGNPDPNIVSPQVSWIDSGSLVASPKFFYMPSVLLPTNGSSTDDGLITYVEEGANKYYVVDLFGIFSKQFTSPIKSSVEGLSLANFVKTRKEYDYFILYADNVVFPNSKIEFLEGEGNEGKFKYQVTPDVIVRNGSFMNIVIKVK